MGLFKFNEDVRTELFFNDSGANTKRTILNGDEEEMIAKNAITFIVHYFSIVTNPAEKEAVKNFLIKCFENDFKQTRTQHYTYETNHKDILSEIVNIFSERENKAVTKYFGAFNIGNIATCTERTLLAKLYEEYGYSIDEKPTYGKYIFKFKIKNNVPFCKLNIAAGKDKILLPLSTSITTNYAFLDLDKLKPNFVSACLDFLSNHSGRKISTTEKLKLLSILFEKHFLTN